MNNKSLYSRRQEIFFNNLVALGFDVHLMTKEHKRVFDKNMFSLPNQKAFEVVSHFLFSKLNEVSGEKYSIIWPLVDAQDKRKFQKLVLNYLTDVAQHSEIRFPPVLNSVISTFGREAFSDLYFAFSTHVVHEVNKTYGPMLRRPKFHPQLTKHAIKMQKLASIDSVEKFQALAAATKFHVETYINIARKLTECASSLKFLNSKSNSMLKERVMLAVEIITERSDTLHSLEELIAKNREYQDKVELLWGKLENFLSTEESLWNKISSELKTNLILRGSAFSFPVSDNLRHSYEKRYGAEVPEEGSSICIPRFLKMFSLVLEFYIDSMKRGQYLDETPAVQCTSELDESLKMLRSFCTILEESNVANKKSVARLMEEINLDDFTKDKPDFLENLPPSPTEFVPVNKKVPLFFCFLDEDMKLNENIEGAPEVDNFVKQGPSIEDSFIMSPDCATEKNTETSLNNESIHQSFDLPLAEKNFSPQKGYTKKDSDKDLLESLLNSPGEETLYSQTLCEQASFSFLD